MKTQFFGVTIMAVLTIIVSVPIFISFLEGVDVAGCPRNPAGRQVCPQNPPKKTC